MDNGWIKLHRKITHNAIWRRSAYAHLWVTLLLKANHRPDTIMWNGGILFIKESQLITGREKLAEETGIPESTIERALAFLEQNGFIEQQKTTKFRLITIVNWQDYQKPNNKRTTDGQQADTNKKVKKYKNDKNTPSAPSADDEVAKFIHLFKGVNPSVQKLYGREPQREAARRLLKQHPLQWWEKFMTGYAVKFTDRFCPKATTPVQLEDKLANIYAFAERSRSGGGKGIISSVPN